MSDSTPAGKLGKAAQVVKDHPVLTGLALFAGALAITRTVTRRTGVQDNELPLANGELGEVRDVDLVDHEALRDVRDNDGPLGKGTQS